MRKFNFELQYKLLKTFFFFIAACMLFASLIDIYKFKNSGNKKSITPTAQDEFRPEVQSIMKQVKIDMQKEMQSRNSENLKKAVEFETKDESSDKAEKTDRRSDISIDNNSMKGFVREFRLSGFKVNSAPLNLLKNKENQTDQGLQLPFYIPAAGDLKKAELKEKLAIIMRRDTAADFQARDVDYERSEDFKYDLPYNMVNFNLRVQGEYKNFDSETREREFIIPFTYLAQNPDFLEALNNGKFKDQDKDIKSNPAYAMLKAGKRSGFFNPFNEGIFLSYDQSRFYDEGDLRKAFADMLYHAAVNDEKSLSPESLEKYCKLYNFDHSVEKQNIRRKILREYYMQMLKSDTFKDCLGYHENELAFFPAKAFDEIKDLGIVIERPEKIYKLSEIQSLNIKVPAIGRSAIFAGSQGFVNEENEAYFIKIGDYKLESQTFLEELRDYQKDIIKRGYYNYFPEIAAKISDKFFELYQEGADGPAETYYETKIPYAAREKLDIILLESENVSMAKLEPEKLCVYAYLPLYQNLSYRIDTYLTGNRAIPISQSFDLNKPTLIFLSSADNDDTADSACSLKRTANDGKDFSLNLNEALADLRQEGSQKTLKESFLAAVTLKSLYEPAEDIKKMPTELYVHEKRLLEDVDADSETVTTATYQIKDFCKIWPDDAEIKTSSFVYPLPNGMREYLRRDLRQIALLYSNYTEGKYPQIKLSDSDFSVLTYLIYDNSRVRSCSLSFTGEYKAFENAEVVKKTVNLPYTYRYYPEQASLNRHNYVKEKDKLFQAFYDFKESDYEDLFNTYMREHFAAELENLPDELIQSLGGGDQKVDSKIESEQIKSDILEQIMQKIKKEELYLDCSKFKDKEAFFTTFRLIEEIPYSDFYLDWPNQDYKIKELDKAIN